MLDLVGNPTAQFSFVAAHVAEEKKTEDQWSCKRSPESAAYTNQRTIGPENAHLKPDPAVLSHHEMTLTLNTHKPLLNS